MQILRGIGGFYREKTRREGLMIIDVRNNDLINSRFSLVCFYEIYAIRVNTIEDYLIGEH